MFLLALALVRVLALVQELPAVPAEQEGPPKMVMVRRGESEGQGGAEEVSKDQNNSGNGSSMV